MESKAFIPLLLLMIVVSSCSAPKYVPESGEIPFSAYGSFIEVQQLTGPNIEGELIAVDSLTMFVLTGDDLRQLQNLPVQNIEKFKLTYAQPANHGWTIPVYTLSTATHGAWLIFTAPINAVVTSLVTARGANAFTYNEKAMSYEKLRMFARFPQGIPPNIDSTTIR